MGWGSKFAEAMKVGLRQVLLLLMAATLFAGAAGFFVAALFIWLNRELDTPLAALLTGVALLVATFVLLLANRQAPSEPHGVQHDRAKEGGAGNGGYERTLLSLVDQASDRPWSAVALALALGILAGAGRRRRHPDEDRPD